MTEPAPKSPIHARGVSPAKYKQLLRLVNRTAGTKEEVTWNDLVSLGECKPTHPERRRQTTAAIAARVRARQKTSRPAPRRRTKKTNAHAS